MHPAISVQTCSQLDVSRRQLHLTPRMHQDCHPEPDSSFYLSRHWKSPCHQKQESTVAQSHSEQIPLRLNLSFAT